MFVRSSIPRKRTAAATVETAVVLPTLLLCILGVFDFGHYYLTRHRLLAAASEAGRVAVAGTSTRTTEELRNLVQQRLAGLVHGQVDVRIYQVDNLGYEIGPWANAGFGERICVQVDAQFDFLTPLLGILPNRIPIRAKSIQLSEGD